MRNLFYVPFVGIWVCMALLTVGLILCATIIGIPPGLALIALGFKSLTLKPRPKVVVNAETRPHP